MSGHLAELRLSQIFGASLAARAPREAREAEAWSNLAERSVTPSSSRRELPHEPEVEATGPERCIVLVVRPFGKLWPTIPHQAQSRLSTPLPRDHRLDQRGHHRLLGCLPAGDRRTRKRGSSSVGSSIRAAGTGKMPKGAPLRQHLDTLPNLFCYTFCDAPLGLCHRTPKNRPIL